MQTITETACTHCGKLRDRTSLKFVTIQRWKDGRYKNESILVCTDTCSNFLTTRNDIKVLRRRLQTQQRRPVW
ncbi:hypothetical protein [Serratia quinivorans]|uniref:hypothetical protein n=1 Tax=Serratia quinivorans TaxID=137545 RepID=UPI003F9AA1FB